MGAFRAIFVSVLVALACRAADGAAVTPQPRGLHDARGEAQAETPRKKTGVYAGTGGANADVLPDAVTENVLCALLHLQVPAQYWASAQNFVALQKVLGELTEGQRLAADLRVTELVRARQIEYLHLKQSSVIDDDEFEALTRQEVILFLRRREQDNLMQLFAKQRKPTRYLTAQAQLVKEEIAALSKQVEMIRKTVGERPAAEPPVLTSDEQLLQKSIEASRATNGNVVNPHDAATGVIGEHEHKLRNIVEMDDDALYRQKARELRRRIESAVRASEKQALRGELATLYQRHSTQGSGSPRRGVYRTLKGETPAQVAELLGIDVNRLLVANVNNRPDLTPWTKLEQGSPLIVPKLLLHQAQQRLHENTIVGEAQLQARKMENLHADLLRAVENQDYKRAADIADKLKEVEDAKSAPTIDAGDVHRRQNSKAGRVGADGDKTNKSGSKPKKILEESNSGNEQVENGYVAATDALKPRVGKLPLAAEKAKQRRQQSNSNGAERVGSKAKSAAKIDEGTHATAKKGTPSNPKPFVSAKAVSMVVHCAACGSPIRLNNIHGDITIARVMELAVAQGLPLGYDSFLYKGRFFPSHLTVKDLRIPAKDSRNVKVSVMKGAKQEKGPDPLGLRKGGGNSEEVGT